MFQCNVETLAHFLSLHFLSLKSERTVSKHDDLPLHFRERASRGRASIIGIICPNKTNNEGASNLSPVLVLRERPYFVLNVKDLRRRHAA